MMKDRYYVQRLTEQIFLVREHASANGESDPDDPIVHSFTIHHDAATYANNLNETQREVDEHDGHKARRAI